MAAVDITISGVIYDKLSRTARPITIVGEASLTGLSVGGGPVIPPGAPPSDPGAHPEHPIYYPPGIWGPTDPRPTPPIYMPGPHPEHPIVIPPAPTEPPTTPSEPKPPPADGGWGWAPDYGWGYFPGPGEAEPKKNRRG